MPTLGPLVISNVKSITILRISTFYADLKEIFADWRPKSQQLSEIEEEEEALPQHSSVRSCIRPPPYSFY